jgi:hypothetical protein
MKTSIQSLIFQEIKLKIGNQDSLGNALSEVLHISPDAVYRRYRNETPLSASEIQKICKQYNISFDKLAEIGTGKAMFDFPPLNTYDFSLVSYLEGIRDRFVHLKSFSNPKILLAINNVQFFQLLNFPQLVRFRLFFWAKTHLQMTDYANQKFVHEKTPDRVFELGKEILQLYNQIPTVEIYDQELLRGFMRQVWYYYKAHLFDDPTYAVFLCERALLFVEHLKDQATVGKKFIYGTSAPAEGNKFEMYMNETINSEATFYYESNETKGLFISHNIMNYLHTTDENYVMDTKKILDKQLANSSLISQVNEKERNSYFFGLEKMIRLFKTKIEADLAFE